MGQMRIATLRKRIGRNRAIKDVFDNEQTGSGEVTPLPSGSNGHGELPVEADPASYSANGHGETAGEAIPRIVPQSGRITNSNAQGETYSEAKSLPPSAHSDAHRAALHQKLTRLDPDEQADLAELEEEDPNLAHQVEEMEVEGEGNWLRKLVLNPRTLISFVAAIVIIVFLFTTVFKNLDLASIGQELGQTNLGFFALGFLVYYAAFIVRGFRWRILLNNAGVGQAARQHTGAVETVKAEVVKAEAVKSQAKGMPAAAIAPGDKGSKLPALGELIEAIYLSWFVNCIVPAKLGDAYRSFLLKRDADISFSRSIGTILAERILDIIVLFGLLLASGLLIGTRILGQNTLLLGLGAVMVVVIIIGLAVLARRPQLFLRILPHRFHDLFLKFQHGTVTSFRRDTLPQVLLLTGMVWLMEGGRLYFITRAIDAHDKTGQPIALSVVIFLALASSLLTTLPITPAGLGFVEGVMIGVLSQVISPASQATAQAGAITVLDRLINYWSIVLIGIIVYIISTARHSRKMMAATKR